MTKTITTSIIINAPAEKVWKILMDFENYSTWNPFIKSITGDVKVGKTITAKIQDMTFKPRVLVLKENEEFRWVGKLLFSGLFDGEHIFCLKNNLDGTTTFEQSENFKGILVGLFAKKLDGETRDGFISMNEKLKEVVESMK